MRTAERRLVALFLAGLTTACGDGGTTAPPVPVPPPPPPPAPALIRVWPATVALGGTVARSARAEDATGQPMSVTVAWASDDPSVAAVSSAGVVTGQAAGQTTLRASAGGKTGTAIVTVTDLRWARLWTPSWHSCGLTVAGDLYCWGLVTMGVAGPVAPVDQEPCGNQESCFATPRKLSLGPAFVSVVSGKGHSCGLTAAGAAHCWGSNALGQLGTPTTDPCNCSPTPVPVTGGLVFAKLLTTQEHTCGLTAAGEAWCWGRNDRRQLGATTVLAPFSVAPVRSGGARLFTALAPGYTHTCGIATDGKTYCWGSSASGELGSVRAEGALATEVSGGIAFQSISSGDMATCGLTAEGTAYCWGSAVAGQLGNGGYANSAAPVAVAGGHTFSSVSMGHFFACGLDTAAKGWCWGLNLYGSLGIGGPAAESCADATCSSTPVAVSGGLSFVALEAGNWVACGLTANQRAYCWGANNYGQTGHGELVGNQLAPAGVAGAAK